MWLQSLLQELMVVLFRELLIWCDKLSTVALSTNPVFHSRSKHFELDLHFVRERVLDKRLMVSHILSSNKWLIFSLNPALAFNRSRKKLTVENSAEFRGNESSILVLLFCSMLVLLFYYCLSSSLSFCYYFYVFC